MAGDTAPGGRDTTVEAFDGALDDPGRKTRDGRRHITVNPRCLKEDGRLMAEGGGLAVDPAFCRVTRADLLDNTAVEVSEMFTGIGINELATADITAVRRCSPAPREIRTFRGPFSLIIVVKPLVDYNNILLFRPLGGHHSRSNMSKAAPPSTPSLPVYFARTSAADV